MAARSGKTFNALLSIAEDQLWLGFNRAGLIEHRGLKGAGRENALARFIESQLPGRFGVTTGEAVDSEERRTGQLDVIIYDRNLTAPLVRDDSGDLLPAESLLAVVEVKSRLTQGELNACAAAAKRVAALRPYGMGLLAPRKRGLDASDGKPRCQYSVVAFDSNLSAKDWAEKEWKRLCKSAKKADVPPRRLDRVLVMNRGMLVPPFQKARSANQDGQGMLREWFLHMSNFVIREADRRSAFDFQKYARRKTNPGWTKLSAP